MDAKLLYWIENTLIPKLKVIKGYPYTKSAIILNAIDRANPSSAFKAYSKLSGISPGNRYVADGLEELVCYTDKAVKEFIEINNIEDLTFVSREMLYALAERVSADGW